MLHCRSWLFVPGHSEKMVDKSFCLGADVVMFDLEDGVLPELKSAARAVIADSLGRAGVIGPRRFVRINSIGGDDAPMDLDEVVKSGLDGIVLPKVESAENVRQAVAVLEQLERERGIGTPLSIVATIESASGLLEASSIARASERVCALMLGAEDFGRDIGLPVRRVGEAYELLFARSSLVVAAAAARVQSIDQVWPDITDITGLSCDAEKARRIGFTGKSLIHPAQIDCVNEVFSPSSEDLEFAHQVVEAFEKARSKGLGSVAFGGQLLDKPIVDRARATIEMNRQLKERAS